MLIGLDGLPFAFVRTGVGHYTLELGRALAAESPEDEFRFVYPSNYPTVKAPDRLPANLTFCRVEVGRLSRRWWSFGLPRYLRKSEIELFHGTNYEIPVWGRCPAILTIHDLSLLLYPETHARRAVRRARRRLPLMVRAADAIITPTQTVRNEVCEHLKVSPHNVFAVPEAARAYFSPIKWADTGEVRKRLGIRDEFLLAVGTIEPRKNLICLVQAFEQIVRKRPQCDLQLVIAGSRGWLADPILTAIEKSSARPQILLTGYLNDAELRALYSSCRAFVYPSLYEGFGLPPLEAMACGAPVLAADIPALRETTGNAATLIAPQDIDGWTRKLINLLDDDNLRQTMSNASIKRANEFTWRDSARQTLNVYEYAIRNRLRGQC